MLCGDRRSYKVSREGMTARMTTRLADTTLLFVSPIYQLLYVIGLTIAGN